MTSAETSRSARAWSRSSPSPRPSSRSFGCARWMRRRTARGRRRPSRASVSSSCGGSGIWPSRTSAPRTRSAAWPRSIRSGRMLVSGPPVWSATSVSSRRRARTRRRAWRASGRSPRRGPRRPAGSVSGCARPARRSTPSRLEDGSSSVAEPSSRETRRRPTRRPKSSDAGWSRSTSSWRPPRRASPSSPPRAICSRAVSGSWRRLSRRLPPMSKPACSTSPGRGRFSSALGWRSGTRPMRRRLWEPGGRRWMRCSAGGTGSSPWCGPRSRSATRGSWSPSPTRSAPTRGPPRPWRPISGRCRRRSSCATETRSIA